ncbi:MAG: pyridoxal-phosphate dependent enzyme [Candidatus Woesearchaeota archaeon]
MIINNITEAIGNTPLMLIEERIHGVKGLRLYAKLELMNPYGSLKDRIATRILDVNDARGKTVIESSSGNTAKALAGIAGAYNLPFKTITNRIKQPEVRMILQAMGAQIKELPGHSECPDPNDPNDALAVIDNMIRENPESYYHTNQYFNENNIRAHNKTGIEISKDLERIDYFYGYLGTCGSTRGIGEILKKERNTSVIGIVTEDGEYVPGGRTESELYETGFYKSDFYNEIVKGTIQEAIDGMLILLRKAGIPCGPTTGLSYSALIKRLKNIDIEDGTTAVFIACDRIEPYMSYLQKYRPTLFEINKENQMQIVSYDDMMTAKEIEYNEIKEDDIIIDIRSNYSYNKHHHPSSINMESHIIEEMIMLEQPFPKNKRIIMVCAKGLISKRYAIMLERKGYDAMSLRGGYLGITDKQ